MSDPKNYTAYGLFGNFIHSSSYDCGNVTFNSCSIDFTDGLTGATSRYYGTFVAFNNGSATFRNIHIKNSLVSHNRTGDTGNLRQYMGGIIGRQNSGMTSCSAENTTVYYNTTVLTSNQPACGILSAYQSTLISYSYVKSCSLFTNRYSTSTNNGLLAGGVAIYAYDCYVLNSEISGAYWVAPFGTSANVSTRRIYVAGINYGNTVDAQKYPFMLDTTPLPLGHCFWESGSNSFTVGLDVSKVTSASFSEIKSIRYLRKEKETTGFDFENVWGKNDEFQNGYPFLRWEQPTIESCSYSGIVSSSLGIVMENVTMSFFNSGTNDINWKIYSDANGAFTQSIHNGWSGSLAVTQSGYEFFPDLNDNLPRYISPTVSDIIEDTNGVKNFSSGSGVLANPYIVLDYEDCNNIRFRCGVSSGNNGY